MAKSHVLESEVSAIFHSRTFQTAMLDWYAKNHRILPWRAMPEDKANPYHVWLSEIMLQQTTVATVIPYFEKFTTLWPDIHALASAPSERVMAEWAGLGYYARARNMHACAKVVSTERGGIFPHTPEELENLPGIGPYTAAAIASIAFGIPSVVIDGNIERIAARCFTLKEPLPKAKLQLKKLAARLFDGMGGAADCQHFPQALMDLGSMVCTPKSPKCGVCPVAGMCGAHNDGFPEIYPIKLPKVSIPLRKGKVYWLTSAEGGLLVEKRPENRMLGGMMGLPTTDWDRHGTLIDWEELAVDLSLRGKVMHVFSHFKLELEVFCGNIRPNYPVAEKSHIYVLPKCANMDEVGFPSLFQKVVSLAK
ncbi:MAG: A/G-specific adenine glycosylase [Pseudobdellovibrionaceae bacterium]